MKWIAIAVAAAWLLSPARPIFADDKPAGDASNCRALQMLADARPYIDCIDAAREEAIAALIAGTHPAPFRARSSAVCPMTLTWTPAR